MCGGSFAPTRRRIARVACLRMQEVGMRETRTLHTSHGLIWIEQSGHGELPVLLIYGNSSCLEVFRYQIDGPPARQNWLIAFDLPGHGRSGDRSGSHLHPAGFRRCVARAFSCRFESRLPRLGGRRPSRHWRASFYRDWCWRNFNPFGDPIRAWSDGDVERFGHAIFDEAFSPDLKTALVRADGMPESRPVEPVRAPISGSSRRLTMPIAVVNGAEALSANRVGAQRR